jgi:2-pyrone-4,6-dicarboxylate lactonase
MSTRATGKSWCAAFEPGNDPHDVQNVQGVPGVNTTNQTTDIPVCAPPDPYTRRPDIVLPRHSCDCHAHICGPAAEFPYYDKRVYTPADCLLPDYRRVLETLGVDRAVLVQPSFYADDNRVLLGALRAGGKNFRGVAVVPPTITDRALEEMHGAGVRGIRVNVVDTRDTPGELPLRPLRELAARVRPLGWHVEFLAHVDEFPDLDQLLEDFPVDVVFGHLGYVPTEAGVETKGFQALLRLMRERRAWVKLTGPYRISKGTLPFADTNPFAAALLEAAPDRVVWGTDWPHVKAAWSIAMPNDGDLAGLLAQWVPPHLRRRVLVENPIALYGFDPADD